MRNLAVICSLLATMSGEANAANEVCGELYDLVTFPKYTFFTKEGPTNFEVNAKGEITAAKIFDASGKVLKRVPLDPPATQGNAGFMGELSSDVQYSNGDDTFYLDLSTGKTQKVSVKGGATRNYRSGNVDIRLNSNGEGYIRNNTTKQIAQVSGVAS